MKWLERYFGLPAPIVETPYPIRRRVIVNTKSGQVFRGALWETAPDFLVLKGAELLTTKSDAVPIDGDAIVYRSNVTYFQVLGVAQEE